MSSVLGPSPRVRGKLADIGYGFAYRGSIPARAGETARAEALLDRHEVHPRACGGNELRPYLYAYQMGPSPRVRGKQRWRRRVTVPSGSIPARAGETLNLWHVTTLRWVHPRACGGNPFSVRAKIPGVGPSPRVRGKHRLCPCHFHDPRSIPARAGETPPEIVRRLVLRVHPRACGGNS